MRLLSRPTTLLMMLGASVAVPYAVGNHSQLLGTFSSSGKSSGASLPSGVPGEDPLLATGDPLAVLYPSGAPLEGPPAATLEEVFRFDVTREWVLSRWPRKSVVPGEDSLIGLRVPLVSGTSIDDVAGSLTYYFNAAGQVQHIAFQGTTGDPQRLVRLIVGRFSLLPQTSAMPGEHVYQKRWNGRPQSELVVRPAALIWSSSPHSTFDVELALERPGSNRFLKP